MAAAIEIANEELEFASGARSARVADRHVGILLYVVISFAVTMSLHQLGIFERGSLQWWLLVGVAVLIPMADIAGILQALFTRCFALLAFLLISGTWYLAKGDLAAVIQLGLLVWTLCWLSSGRAYLRVDDLARVYIVFVCIGLVIMLAGDFNPYGLIPGRTAEEFGRWRVSFFPNIAYSGAFSMAMVMLLTKDRATAHKHRAVLLIALYFLIFSFVRTAYIAMLIFVFLRWLFRSSRNRSPLMLFSVVFLMAVVVNLLIAYSPAIVVQLQQLPLIAEVLLQGKTELSEEEIYNQIYRPWLWYTHIMMGLASPSLMGWGAFDFAAMVAGEEIPIESAGTECLPTRLIASYGVVGLLFLVFYFGCLARLCRARDYWGCAAFSTTSLLMMHWGSMFHPTDATFIIYMSMALSGSAGFRWSSDEAETSAVADVDRAKEPFAAPTQIAP